MGTQNSGHRLGLRCHGARVKTQAGNATDDAIADRTRGMLNPQVRRSTWPDDRPTSRAVGTFDVCSNSDLSYFLYRGRLKQPHLHCRADAVV